MNNGKRSRFLITTTCFGLAFLYIPILLLIFYSFNKSRIVPVWGGFSTKWYGVLFESEPIWEAVVLSLKVATVNACFATILGTLAGLALVRFGSFKGLRRQKKNKLTIKRGVNCCFKIRNGLRRRK